MKYISLLILSLLLTTPAIAADGMINIKSNKDVKQTADSLVDILKARGMTVFNRISHSDAAKDVGIDLRDTELVIFGSPRAGSPVMLCQQTIALDLPQKALILQDADSTVWLSYNNPAYLEKRHSIAGCDEALDKIATALGNIAKEATN